MKEIPVITTEVKNGDKGYHTLPLFSERPYAGIVKVFEGNKRGNQYEIGEYNPESFLVECEEGRLLNYLVEYKGYTVFATTPITSGYGRIWKGTGENHTSTKIVYSLKKPDESLTNE